MRLWDTLRLFLVLFLVIMFDKLFASYGIDASSSDTNYLIIAFGITTLWILREEKEKNDV